ncbi:uncharacterized protein LOC133631035 [Entelurus aequoreus]|uniref:uncharacterized protein LOC133631035 n=1 Tax=Entelurus aequoreus TaxID=161455 RepID=UPI002B1DEFC3|nr:uncharacterized protein LOC133631035 [Entelurus aequoreus]XP_061878992.1 uncharacterized protein LOC133631035 [Entelurus aequoreus]XP_061878993.1 uncharacterized protein LOC133631035 [Entelurus aequoreus]XP_061878994.1 uncharacterized protein LOC133631035 [Entelurus aequoreus]XP_061878995.1 uncharacterized protein LOC133631035 [Entelurus aequoreus]XP_061878996.1 uncharacterized protein LOC133631035 [Entelurus aequoreus]XP_061878997.1 uncharacterized protein LOC133631035 [Entelurus aequoreu
MQTCALMNELSWQSSNRIKTHASTNNCYLYSIGQSSLPSQDGRVYHNVSHDPQSGSHGHQLVPPREFQHSVGQDGRVYHNVSHYPQSGSHGPQFVPPREFQQSVGQNLSEWSRPVTSCSQSDAVVHWRPTRLHSHCVVSDASQHRFAFYHNMATPSQYPDNSIANSPSAGQSLLNTNAHQKSEQCSPSTPVVSKQVMHPAAACHSPITSAHGRTPQACPSLRRHLMDMIVSQQSPPHPPQPLQNSIPETIQLQTSELDWSKTRRHHQYQIDHKLQAPEPLSSHCTNTELAPETMQTAIQLISQKYPLIFKMLSPTTRIPEKNQDRSSLPVCDLATKGCASSGQGSTGLSFEVFQHQKDSCSGDSLGQTDKKVPETHQDNPEQNKRTLQSLTSSTWTTNNLVALVQKFQQAQIKSESSAFCISHLTDLFWNNDSQMLRHQIKSSWYKNLMTDILAFLSQHWTADSVVLTQAKCNLNVEGLHVLQDGEEYVEPHYVSSWRNVNEQLDDIDKESGCAMTFDSCLPDPLVPTSGAPETANTSKVVEEQEHGEQEDEQEVKRIEDEEQRTSSVTVAHANEDDIYSFVIQVLPQEEAKAIYENSKLVGDHPFMQVLPPKETQTIYENSQPAGKHPVIHVLPHEEAKTIYENSQPVRDQLFIQVLLQEEAKTTYENSQPAGDHFVLQVLPQEEAKNICENSQPAGQKSFIHVLPEEDKTIYENSESAGQPSSIHVPPQEEAKTTCENFQPAGQKSFIHVLPEEDKTIYKNSQPTGQKSIIHVRPQEEAKTIYENSQPAGDRFVIQVLPQEEAKNIYENTQPTGQKSFIHVLPEKDKTIYENSESAGQPSHIHVPPQEEAKTICENFQPAGQKSFIHVLPEEDKTIYENSQPAKQKSIIHVPPQEEAKTIYENVQPAGRKSFIHVLPEEDKTIYKNFQPAGQHYLIHVLPEEDKTIYENSQSARQPSSIHVPPQEEAQTIYENFQPVRDHPVVQVVPQEETKTSYENSQSVRDHLFNKVLLQGETTCINKYSLPAGDHPTKELLKGSKVDQVDSRADKDLSAESEVELFFAQWKEDFLSCTPTTESEEDLSHTVLEDEEAVLDCASCTDGRNPSINPNHAKDSSLFQHDDQETGNVPQRRTDIISNAFCRERILTSKWRQWCTELKRSNKSEMVPCFGTKRKRARHSAINVPVLKKLKTCKRRSDLRSARRKDSAKSVQPVKLVLFGTAGRRPNWTRPMSAPEVLSVSRRGMSAVKQRIYQEWSLPPTRIESRSKLGNQKRPFTERWKSEDGRDKEKLLPEMMFRKDNNKLSRKKRRPRSDGQGIREKDWWRRSKDGEVRKYTEDHSGKFWNASKPANPSGRK